MDILDVDLHHLKHDVDDDDHHALLDSAAAAVLDEDASHALRGVVVGDDDEEEEEEESGVTLPDDDDDDDAELRQLSMRGVGGNSSNSNSSNSNRSKRRKIGKALQLILLRKYVQCAKQLDHLPSRATTEQLLEEGYDEFYFHGGSLREPRLGYTAFLKLVRNRRGEVMRQTRDLQTLSHGRGSRRNQKERMEIRTLIDELERVRQSTMRSPLGYEALDGGDTTGSSSGGTISAFSSTEQSIAGHHDDVSLSSSVAAGASAGGLIGAADLQGSEDVLISREKLDMMLRFAQETLQAQKKILDEVRAIEQRLDINQL